MLESLCERFFDVYFHLLCFFFFFFIKTSHLLCIIYILPTFYSCVRMYLYVTFNLLQTYMMQEKTSIEYDILNK